MAEQNVGCIHDYTITTNDMKKIENADIFVQNGLGLEIFMDKILSIYPNLKILNSSEDITNLIKEDKINSHIWTSIDNYIMQVEKISQVLIQENAENREIYVKNTEEYIKSLKELKEMYNAELKGLSGERAVCLNEALEYLAKDINLKVTSLHTDHDEGSVSAENLRMLIDEMKNEDIKIILVGKEDNIKNAEIIANETGAKIYKLNTSLNGEINNTSYINEMKENIRILKDVEGNED